VFSQKTITVVLPAYNAAKTLRQTVAEIDRELVDRVILVDDRSHDDTVQIARELDLEIYQHESNRGYGGNQKTCYKVALDGGADIVVMLHPDYQYTPKLIPAMAGLLATGLYDISLGSRILGGGALRGGMPLHRWVSNRFLTFLQNLATGMKLSEYHTGYRAFTREVLEILPFERNSDDFIFDNQILMQARLAGFRTGEISCPTKYFEDASSINFRRSIVYGLGCLWNCVLYLAARWRIYTSKSFDLAHHRVSR
jgi:glycosyltransferase involved in cell wall biosynthesis